MKTLIYARCSTDENKQDVEVQLKELRRYCEQQGWEYDEIFEYGSGYKGDQPKLKEQISYIKAGYYQVVIVYAMDRFSREHPRKVDELLNRIVYDYKCRFISLSDAVDSSDEVKWHIMRHMMTYFANIYSRKLSERVTKGIQRAKEKGSYRGGRPSKLGKVDATEIKKLYSETGSLRKTAELYNQSRYKDNRISRMYVKRIMDGDISVS
jgi:DNA invertase Pin-like site-specific DNA recombinase